MAAPMIQIEHLTKRFQTGGGFLKRPRAMLAVRDVSLTIAKGEVVGVVGESGCGKSTLARRVLHLLEPSFGRVTLDGSDLISLAPSALRAARKRRGMVFQDPYSSLDPRFSVADVLTEPFTVQRRPLPPARSPQCSPSSACRPRWPAVTRINFPAVSANVSASPALWRCARNLSCWTNPRPR